MSDAARGDADSNEGTVSSSSDLADLTFGLRTTWRDVLPDEPPNDALVLRRVAFDADPTASATNQFERRTPGGLAAEVAVGGGVGTFRNDGTESCAERFLVTGRQRAPHFSTLLRVTERSGRGARPAVGLDTATGDVSVTVGGEAGAITVETPDGDGERRRVGEAPEAPFDLLVTWLGVSAAVFTRSPGGGWTHRGRFEWEGDPYADWEATPQRPWWGYDLSPGASLSVSEVSLLGTAGFGVRDPALVTRRDGTPLLDGRHVYLACSAGAPGRGFSYQCVLRLHVDTYALDLTALLFADTGGGSRYPDNAAHVVYDDRTDEFVVAFSGFGSKHLGSADGVRVSVGRTDRNVLAGVHTVAVEPANLPTRSDVWDPFLVYDEAAGAWRCAHTYDGSGALAVSETTDESLTGGWEPVHVFDGANEGTKLLAVDDGYLCTYTDEGQPAGMAVSDYPQIGRNERPIDVDPPTEAAFDTGFTSHPMVIPVDEGESTRHLLVGFDGSQFADLDVGGDAAKRTRGALYVYEAE